jgi:enoyl-CoA hydratase/carnithine racemase
VIVTLQVSDGLAPISVNNPPVNTINAATRRELFQALADIRARSDIRAVLLERLVRERRTLADWDWTRD